MFNHILRVFNEPEWDVSVLFFGLVAVFVCFWAFFPHISRYSDESFADRNHLATTGDVAAIVRERGNVPEAEMLSSSSSVGDVPYTLGSTNGVKEDLEPPLPPIPYCRAQRQKHSRSHVCLMDRVQQETVKIKETQCGPERIVTNLNSEEKLFSLIIPLSPRVSFISQPPVVMCWGWRTLSGSEAGELREGGTKNERKRGRKRGRKE